MHPLYTLLSQILFPATPHPGQAPTPAPIDFKTAITTFFSNLTTIGTSVGLVVATFFVLVGGFLYMTANGNVRALDRAKTCIVGALIGLGIVLTADVLAQLVFTALGK